jgi:hypothetical protein
VVGRLAWSPAVGHELGVSAHHGAYNIFRAGGEIIAPRRDLTIPVIDVETSVLGVQLSGEAARVAVGIDPALAGIVASRQRGLFLDAERVIARGLLRTMPESAISLKARLDAVDFDTDRAGDGILRLTIGLNMRPTADTVLKLEYARGRERARYNSPAETAAIFLSVASYF